MSNTRTSSIAILLAFGLIGGPATKPSNTAPASPPAGNVAAAPVWTAAEALDVEAARDMYAEWGFDFPQAAIRFHAESMTPCDGNAGLYQELVDGSLTVDVCYQNEDTELEPFLRRLTLWHEIGHAYIEPNIDEDTRSTFLDLVDLTSWHGGEWEQRGAEYATEVLVWGMTRGEYNYGLILPDLECHTKTAGFTILTGLEGPPC